MGKGAPKSTKAKTAKSAYSGVQNYSVSLDGLASGLARKNGKTIETSGTLDPSLRQAQGTAKMGFNNGLSYLATSPQSRMTDIAEGRNDFYNLASELAQQDYNSNISAANKSFSSRGLEDSTTRGSYLAKLGDSQLTRELTNRIAALDYLDQKATSDISTNNAVLGNLANIQLVPVQMASQNLNTGFGAQDSMAQFNAQQQQQADQFNAQMAQQAAQQRSQFMGNMIGAGLSLAAIPLTGGMSGLGAISSMSKLGSGAAGSFMPMASSGSNPFSGMTSSYMSRLAGVGRAA